MKRFFLAVLLFPLLSLAQDPAGPKSAGEFVVSMLPAFFALLSTLITALIVPALRGWLQEKAKTNALARVAVRIELKAEAVVAYLNAGMRAKFEEAAKDGKITAEEGAQLRDEALRLLKEFLGKEGLDSIAGVLGLGAGLVDTFLKGSIEKAVEKANISAAGKVAGEVFGAPASGTVALPASPQ